MKKLFLIDISSLFFRAFFAVRPLTSPAGLPTNAIYGVLSMLMKLLKDEKPEYMAICYDRKDPSFRKDLYSEYKANRSEMPEDLAPQIPYIKKMAELLGIPTFEVPQFEADDLIGSLVKEGRRLGMEVYIVSGDKDFAQLLVPHVYLYDTMKDQKIDVAGAIEKWGVPPEQFIDYLALVGDTSDNIPGVAGIGPKGAQKLLTEYKNLEGIFENLENIKGANQEKLRKGKEDAFLSRKLSAIVTDCLKVNDVHALERRSFSKTELSSFLTELNFKGFERNIWDLDIAKSSMKESDIIAPEKIGSQEIKLNTDNKETSISGSSIKSEDPESEGNKTTSSEKLNNENASLQTLNQKKFTIKDLSWVELIDQTSNMTSLWMGQSHQGIYFSDEEIIYNVQGDFSELSYDQKDIFWEKTWLGHDLKSLWHLLYKFNETPLDTASAETEVSLEKKLNQKKIPQPKADWDSLLAAYAIKPGESPEFLRIGERYLGQSLPELLGHQEHLNISIALKEKLQMEMKAFNVESVYSDLDLPLATVLFQMECEGILLDKQILLEQSNNLAKDLQNLEAQIHHIAGEKFNIGSPKQLAVILFDKLGLPPSKKTKTGYSTDTDVLEKLAPDHEIARLMIRYREYAKLKSTYVDSLPLLVKEDGRIHSTFNQALTTTGRLSSVDPNLQNIPIRTERGALVREAFIASPGCSLISVDYSQIELRILAHICGDENLKIAFQNDLDIHAATAAEVFAVKVEDVTADQRRIAKAVNFGIAYGQGAFGLAETLHIPRSEASEIIKKYFTRFSKVQNYIEETILRAREKGYVETLFGRRRYIEELKSKNGAIQKFGERAAINAPIQGTASDLVRKAMIELKGQIKSRLLLQVHDELIFEVENDLAETECAKIKNIMENVTQLSVPLKANSEIGKSWGFNN